METTADIELGDVVAPSRAVSIELTATPVLSYALAHNRLPVVSRLALTADRTLRGATVRLSVRDAEGSIAQPVELLADVDAGRTTVLTGIGLVMDPAAMLHVEEQRPGVVDVEVQLDGELLGEATAPVQVLAASQWLATPLPLALEMLAAHVLPNHPAVTGLVAEAAELLEQRTGSGAMVGYAATAERVDEVVHALAEALRRRGVRHSEPPASWADLGQQVRSPGDVLTWRVGTPLDTVVLLAAACEQAGIRPLLWLADGIGGRVGGAHAFLGYWREERSSESAATTDAAPLVNLVDLGLIGLVETTLLTGSADPEQDLHRAAYDGWLTGELDRVLGVTDVHRARRDGILPLPARARTPEGLLQVVEYRPAEHGAPAFPIRTTAVHPSSRPEAPARVQQWKNALLDLSLRNRLINYTERAGLPLTVPGTALPILDNFIHDGTPVTLLPGDQLAAVQEERGLTGAAELPAEQLTELLVERREVHADVTSGGYLPRLRNLAYRAKTVQEETGANNLYLALGSLVWELDGRPLRSPLLLVPVVLAPVGRTGSYRLSLDESGSSTPNYCLLEKLRQVHGLVVPTLTDAAESTLELDRALEAMRVALVGHGLPYRVEATADLAILQFAKYRLWKDLDEHWSEFAQNPLVHHLVHEPTEPFLDPARDSGASVDLDDLAGRLPAPADASQLRAVAEASAGRTFVLEGPPGTGKSQTITNLLARAVADGKRVLFVAEKRAALDVVARRLDAVGMGMFALDLHDKGSRASMVRAQIRVALEHAVAVDEQGLAAESETLRSARRQLARYADRLHTGNAAGLSLYTARTAELTAGTDVEPLPVPLPFVANAPAEVLTAVRRALALLPDIADLTRPSPRHPWAFVDSPEVDLPAAREAAGEVDAAVREVGTFAALGGVLRHARTPEDLDSLVHLLSGPPVGLDVLDETFSGRWTTATGAVLGEVAAFAAFRHPGLDLASPEVLGLPLAEIYVAAQTAAASSWWGRRRRLMAVREEIASCLRPGATVKPTDVPALVENLWRVQTAVQAIAGRASAVPGLSTPEGWNPFTDPGLLEREVDWLRRAGAAVDGSSAFHVALRKLIVAGMPAGSEAASAVARLRDAVTTLLRVCRSSSDQLAAWAGDDGLVLRWSMTRPERGVEGTVLMSLRRWVSFLDTLEPLRYAGLFDARTLLITGAIAADDAVRALDRGLAVASVAERLHATGLDGFDVEAHEAAITRFTSASRAVREHLAAALPAAVLGTRPFDPATGTGQVGALQRELAKQRRGLGVRQLLTRYGELITAVMPCVLVSPDSVARFFPAAADQFDLVVFDEASQIRVADAVGALGRAKAAVVVGDSKQMPPTSFLEPATSSSDDSVEVVETAVEDEESILGECVQARVPRHWLSWHYRSQDESLIAFSNAQYYENRLSSFPAPTHGRASAEPDGRGVSLVRVPGTFHRSGAGRLLRTNPIEATAIVAEIRRRFDAVPQWEGIDAVPSIGVVTFNAQQRSCIEALLRDADDDRLAAALDRSDGERLFVKNLENVQGDERDVIFFSTGFSPTADGTLPLNFGPLNRQGGERRLNVAITRARRQVVVFSSFDPAQLRAEETSSVGIKHLRAYLDMAEQGTDVLPRSARSAAVVDRHREQIAAALRARGLVVRTDVGLSEFRVDLSVSRPADPATPVMAVLLDGPAWARRGTVGDRDGLPGEVLGDMLRWPVVQRVWLPSWLADPSAVVDRLVAAVDAAPVSSVPVAEPLRLPTAAVESFKGVAALRSSVTSMAVPATPTRPAPKAAAARKPAGPAALDGETPFVPWIPKTAGEKSVLDELPVAKAARVVRRVMTAGVKAEGPIHVDRLAKLTVGAFGLSRVTEARKQLLLSLLPPSAVDGDHLWPDGLDRATWRGFRRQVSSTDRPIEHVAPEEVANAMAALCRAAAGMQRDELLSATAAVFGYKRRAASVTPVLEKALTFAVDSGRLSEQDDGLLTC
ncbi:DUF4011 domain-containing protein [Blastococcus saxobsidens]|uniref:Putative ATP-dependent helicase n=1 Tax=Blastococcus saxobsidens (strain DD2) TaxID=1146883 RepID=H6RS80_BLASD|nr:DUF4011 domain-containing protein [Blastococcus saxobsidens]CCG04274.1 Putative ATP-dependent helicase [Blastococcus saxobsidens DD2]